MAETYTVSDAARVCGVDRRTLQRAIQAGRLSLDAQHCLSRETLIAAGYLDAVPPQSTPHVTPQNTPHETLQSTPRIAPQAAPQSTPQDPPQMAALLPLLERLAIAVEALRLEIQHLREHQPQASQVTPQGTPQIASQSTPQEEPQSSPHILGLYDPRAAAVRIRDLRQQGLSYTLIAVQLTREGIPTRYGKPWEHSSVRYVRETYGRQADAP